MLNADIISMPDKLSVAAKKGASLAGEKGPGIWLRYGRTWGDLSVGVAIDPRPTPRSVALRQLRLPYGNRTICCCKCEPLFGVRSRVS